MSADQSAALIELGCGSAIPSIALFTELINQIRRDMLSKKDNFHSTRSNTNHIQKLFILQDFNQDVLAAVTLPNFFLNWFLAVADDETRDTAIKRCSISVNDELRSTFQSFLRVHNIELVFIAGSWNDIPRSGTFRELATTKEITSPVDAGTRTDTTAESSSLYGIGGFDLILASETIYSPKSTTEFAELVQQLLVPDNLALVAAKKIYFGIGGGIDDFSCKIGLHGVMTECAFKETSGLGREIIACFRN